MTSPVRSSAPTAGYGRSTRTSCATRRVDVGAAINTIQIRRLGPQAELFAPGSEWHRLAHNAQGSWDQHVMENAGIVRLAPPGGAPAHWFVFYSARHWDDDSYAIGYVDCGENIYGLAGAGCEKRTPHHAWMATDAAAGRFGPGTPTFHTSAAGEKLMSLQAWHFAGGLTVRDRDR